jgi:hypothetical protein
MDVLILHQKLTVDEVNLFQHYTHDFFDLWAEIIG